MTDVGSPTSAQPDPFASSSSLDYLENGSSPAIPLGLTFSFPVEQTALDEGKILTWTKGFSAKNAVGHDVVKLLQDAFDRKHMHVRCVALVNDVRRFFISGNHQLILRLTFRQLAPYSRELTVPEIVC